MPLIGSFAMGDREGSGGMSLLPSRLGSCCKVDTVAACALLGLSTRGLFASEASGGGDFGADGATIGGGSLSLREGATAGFQPPRGDAGGPWVPREHLWWRRSRARQPWERARPLVASRPCSSGPEI
jgi:hypothetical protein